MWGVGNWGISGWGQEIKSNQLTSFGVKGLWASCWFWAELTAIVQEGFVAGMPSFLCRELPYLSHLQDDLKITCLISRCCCLLAPRGTWGRHFRDVHSILLRSLGTRQPVQGTIWSFHAQTAMKTPTWVSHGLFWKQRPDQESFSGDFGKIRSSEWWLHIRAIVSWLSPALAHLASFRGHLCSPPTQKNPAGPSCQAWSQALGSTNPRRKVSEIKSSASTLKTCSHMFQHLRCVFLEKVTCFYELIGLTILISSLETFYTCLLSHKTSSQGYCYRMCQSWQLSSPRKARPDGREVCRNGTFMSFPWWSWGRVASKPRSLGKVGVKWKITQKTSGWRTENQALWGLMSWFYAANKETDFRVMSLSRSHLCNVGHHHHQKYHRFAWKFFCLFVLFYTFQNTLQYLSIYFELQLKSYCDHIFDSWQARMRVMSKEIY